MDMSALASFYPPVRRGTPVRLTSAPKVWLRKLCFCPPNGRLDFFWPAGAPSRLPTLLAGLFSPSFNCLKDALSCRAAPGWAGAAPVAELAGAAPVATSR